MTPRRAMSSLRHRLGRSTQRDQSGSALIIALIFVTVVAVIVAGLLQLGDATTLGGNRLAVQKDQLYYADGAIDAAIQTVRTSDKLGLPNSTDCIEGGGPYVLPNPSARPDLPSITVTCTGQTPTGGAAPDQPQNAILTTGTTAPDGFCITGGSNGANNVVTVAGNISSRNSVNVAGKSCPGGTGGGNGNPTLQVLGDLTAAACSGSIVTTTGNEDCSASTTDQDPGYTAAATSYTSLVMDPAPTCVGLGGTIVDFHPGYYSDIPVPPAACANSQVWWFDPGSGPAPGVDYFDFNNTGALQWNLQDKTAVVGGTPSGWSPTTSSDTFVYNLGSGTRCGNNNKPGASQKLGVQWILGGGSSLLIGHNGTYLELCGSSTSANDRQHIALYTYGGADNAAKESRAAATAISAASTVVNDTKTATQFTPVGTTSLADAVSAPDVKSAKAVLSNTTKALMSAQLDLSGFSVPSVTPGSQITAVQVQVAHSENPSSKVSASVAVTPGTPNWKATATASGATLTPVDANGVTCTSYTYECLSQLAQNLTVTYAASLGGNATTGTATVDSVQLQVNYMTPALENSVVTGANPLVSTTVNQNVFLHGTAYTPSGLLFLDVQNTVTTIFDRGVVARALSVIANPSTKQVAPVFQIPAAVPAGRQVVFKAYTGDPASSRPVIVAVVTYSDFELTNGGATQFAYPGFTATVQGWSVQS